jgi:hypothetical protein
VWIALGQVGFRIRHAWVFLSCLLGPFGPLAPVVPVLGYHGRPLCFHGLSLILGFILPLNLGTVLVHSGYSWRVWQVAPVFPLHGGLLICSETSFSATNSSGQGDPTGEVPLSGEVSSSDTA